MVQPPRVAECPVHFECIVTHRIELGDKPGSGNIMIGRVVHIHASESVRFEDDQIDLTKLRSIGRLAGSAYCRVMDRPPSQISR